MRVTFDLANGRTLSVSDDLNCFSVAEYPTGCCNELEKFHKFDNGQYDKRVYDMQELLATLWELSGCQEQP